MIVIAGLGNPGKEYDNTRHNAGFMAIDAMADKYGISVSEKKHKGLIGKGVIEGQKVVLVKPQTYMNLSGECIREVLDYYKVDEKTEFIVLYDDICLDVGSIRVRKKGSAGGHNGIKNIILHLSTEVFQRVRIGVGEKPSKMDLTDWVLGHFKKEDEENLKDAINNTVSACVMMINGETDEAMNRFNKKKEA